MFGALFAPRPIPARALHELAQTFTPRVELDGDGVLLDLQGLGRLWSSPQAVAHALWDRAVARGLGDLQVAVAPTRVGARLLARSRPGLTIVMDGLAARLAPLPITLLELPAAAQQTFARWGVSTLGALADLPAGGLVARLGVVGARWQGWARGEDDRPLLPTRWPEHFEMSLELDWPLEGLEPLSFALGPLLERLAARLEHRGCRTAALTLELHLVDRRVVTRELKTAAPTTSARTWRTLLLLELEARPIPEAIQRITIRAVPTSARGTQFSLLAPAAPSPERLADLLARLRAWTEEGRAGSPCLLPTHRPGAFLMSQFDPPEASPPVAGGAGLTVVLRPFRPPLPVEVTVHEGVPRRVVGSGLRAEVVSTAGPWRASGDWWDTAWSREEWDVGLAGGGVYRIFRDRIRHLWFLEGELD